MIVQNNVPPATTVPFSSIPSNGGGFVTGPGNVAYIKRATGNDAVRIGDGVTVAFSPGDLVEPAANATATMFP